MRWTASWEVWRRSTKIISEDEKNTIAFHEAGHAVVSWLVEFASPLVKVSIVPRGQSLGAAWYLPEERAITTTEQIFDEMCATLGGRAAEEIMFGKISTGALSDLEKVTKQAYAMVSVYGLNERIGNRSYYDSRGENSFTKPYSEETARIIDEEVSAVIEKAYDRAKDILSSQPRQVGGFGPVPCWTTRSSSKKTWSAFWVRVLRTSHGNPVGPCRGSCRGGCADVAPEARRPEDTGQRKTLLHEGVGACHKVPRRQHGAGDSRRS